MKAIMVSIVPKLCYQIKCGKTTMVLRKTRPKIKPPFKCYIYETKTPLRWNKAHNAIMGGEGGRVIGEFVCTQIRKIDTENLRDFGLEQFEEHGFSMYANAKNIYAWRISDFVSYATPKAVYNFCKPCIKNCDNCNLLEVQEIGSYEYTKVLNTCLNRITRAPRSWCYVMELKDA